MIIVICPATSHIAVQIAAGIKGMIPTFEIVQGVGVTADIFQLFESRTGDLNPVMVKNIVPQSAQVDITAD